MSYRTIQQCFDMIKSEDSLSCITKHFIRSLANKKLIKTLRTGNKVLIDFNSLQEYLEKGE